VPLESAIILLILMLSTWAVNSATLYQCVPKKEYFSDSRLEISAVSRWATIGLLVLLGYVIYVFRPMLTAHCSKECEVYSIHAPKSDLDEHSRQGRL